MPSRFWDEWRCGGCKISAAANDYLERALACYRELKSPSGVSWALFFLTKVALVRGDFLRAQKLGEENLAISQREGLGFTWPLNRLGEVAYANGDLLRARSLFEQSMAIEQQSGESYISVATLTGLTLTTIRQKDFVAAHAFLDQMLRRFKKLGNEQDPNLCGSYLSLARLVQNEGDYTGAIPWYRRQSARNIGQQR